MTLHDDTDFWEWVREETYDRGWSIRELERRAGLNRGRISNAANLERQPTLEVCQGLARAFDLSVVEVQRHAGYLPSPPSEDRLQEFEEIAEILASLPDGRIRDETMAAIRAIARDAKQRAEERTEEERDLDPA
jgi:transcriptional regulator with XRE-family HTH domain